MVFPPFGTRYGNVEIKIYIVVGQKTLIGIHCPPHREVSAFLTSHPFSQNELVDQGALSFIGVRTGNDRRQKVTALLQYNLNHMSLGQMAPDGCCAEEYIYGYY